MTFGDADSASLQEEVPGLGFLPSRAGFRIAKVFSTDRCLPGVVTALSDCLARLTGGPFPARGVLLQSLPG